MFQRTKICEKIYQSKLKFWFVEGSEKVLAVNNVNNEVIRGATKTFLPFMGYRGKLGAVGDLWLSNRERLWNILLFIFQVITIHFRLKKNLLLNCYCENILE